MAGYLLTGNRSNFVHVEGSSLWLYECKNHLSPLYTHDSQCFDKIPIYYQDDLYYVDPVSRQTYNFASTIPVMETLLIPLLSTLMVQIRTIF